MRIARNIFSGFKIVCLGVSFCIITGHVCSNIEKLFKDQFVKIELKSLFLKRLIKKY